MTDTAVPLRSTPDEDHDRFARLVWAEWTKLRTVRAWLVALIAAGIVMTVFSVLSASGERRNCGGTAGCPTVVVGPGGEAVADSYELIHRPLAGDGTITVQVASLTGILPPKGHAFGQPIPPAVPLSAGHPGLVPWAKAGLIITASTRQGAPYAAVMVTAGHGVRLQYDYTHDIAGPAGNGTASAARWLRLTRSSETITAYASTDGTRWTPIGVVQLSGLPATVQTGLFVTSPQVCPARRAPLLRLRRGQSQPRHGHLHPPHRRRRLAGRGLDGRDHRRPRRRRSRPRRQLPPPGRRQLPGQRLWRHRA